MVRRGLGYVQVEEYLILIGILDKFFGLYSVNIVFDWCRGFEEVQCNVLQFFGWYGCINQSYSVGYD